MGTGRKTDRDVVLELVQGLPGDSSFDEILRELAFVRMVDRGLSDADKGRTVDMEELRERIRQWQN